GVEPRVDGRGHLLLGAVRAPVHAAGLPRAEPDHRDLGAVRSQLSHLHTGGTLPRPEPSNTTPSTGSRFGGRAITSKTIGYTRRRSRRSTLQGGFHGRQRPDRHV